MKKSTRQILNQRNNSFSNLLSKKIYKKRSVTQIPLLQPFEFRNVSFLFLDKFVSNKNLVRT